MKLLCVRIGVDFLLGLACGYTCVVNIVKEEWIPCFIFGVLTGVYVYYVGALTQEVIEKIKL